MARPLKVFSWVGFVTMPEGFEEHGRAYNTKQVRCVVAATSFAKAREATRNAGLHMPTRPYVALTGNDREVTAACSEAGAVFAQEGRFGGFKRVENGRIT